MAFAATTVWEVRGTGNDANGGSFNSAAAGTDYSQQDSPQVTYTDLVIDATTNTKCTSAGTPFTSAHVGNTINITGGAGFTVQRVQVNSVTSGVATCDKALGTLSSTGGLGKLGGALRMPGPVINWIVAGHTIWIKTATYNVATADCIASATAGSNTAPIIWRGYDQTRGDDCSSGFRPHLHANSGVTTTMFNLTGATYQYLLNLKLTGDGANSASGSGIILGNHCVAINCECHEFKSTWFTVGGTGSRCINCTCDTFATTSGHAGGVGFDDDGANNFGVLLCCTTIGATFLTHGCSASVGWAVCCLMFGMTGNGFDGDELTYFHCTASGNSSHGFSLTGSGQGVNVFNCISYGNTSNGWSWLSAGTNTNSSVMLGNAAGGNGASASNDHCLVTTTLVSITAAPFTDSGSANDYSLNSTAGGGLACVDAAYPSTFPGLTPTNAPDIGVTIGAAPGSTQITVSCKMGVIVRKRGVAGY